MSENRCPSKLFSFWASVQSHREANLTSGFVCQHTVEFSTVFPFKHHSHTLEDEFPVLNLMTAEEKRRKTTCSLHDAPSSGFETVEYINC